MTRRIIRLGLITALRLVSRPAPTVPVLAEVLAVVSAIAEVVIVTVAYVVVAALLYASAASRS